MDIRHAIHPDQAEALDTAGLRRHFLIDTVFEVGAVRATYSHYDRMMVLGIAPAAGALTLDAALAKVAGADYFLERRELGGINVGTGPLKVTADGEVFVVETQEALYLGMGAREVSFENLDPARPARFYANSAPAHRHHPSRVVRQAEASPQPLGALETSNQRTIFKYLHPGVLPTCQIVMGLTRLEGGSVWNTMPAHTHDRRMESYFYFEVPKDSLILHLMGRPEETRHLVVRNEQAVLSPPWSIHSGAGTGSYAFIWAMAGDNQSFADMDFVPMGDLK
ncbi:5-dehydro-4-deoxy-D-glucuronate isomerase [Ancylobacter defluvii]|uniref:4-deoxy-L-threo-5-hexosulose-uronate ketol-isomerase n=1 Tax=Ancylobacter defluvii TaxID=1282440 RepID=A0A9W6K4P3_9HYPH|nr:5-dehydro-4-deoxy-D-glucuronate isomerase [Ancylobacter defluvii]MBS7588841.1 5-dehydro-4-deoxy-D-glucuronate isomerase [Ancylobacter defluvii]GLK86933.1 4-deoxy-L-threo-5-hexosulose-uronate ketol-isomerase [Ancylobacter defluvii]